MFYKCNGWDFSRHWFLLLNCIHQVPKCKLYNPLPFQSVQVSSECPVHNLTVTSSIDQDFVENPCDRDTLLCKVVLNVSWVQPGECKDASRSCNIYSCVI